MTKLFHDVKRDQSNSEANPIIKKIHETNIMEHLSEYAIGGNTKEGGNPKEMKQKICVNHDKIVRLIDELPKNKTDLLIKGLDKWKPNLELVKIAQKTLSVVEKVTFAELKLRVMLRLLKVVMEKVCK